MDSATERARLMVRVLSVLNVDTARPIQPISARFFSQDIPVEWLGEDGLES